MTAQTPDLDAAYELKSQAQHAHAAGDLQLALSLVTDAIQALESQGIPGSGPAAHLLSVLYSNRAALHCQLGAPPDSIIQDAQQAIQHDPRWPKPYLRLVSGLLRKQDTAGALQALDQGLSACRAASADATCDSHNTSLPAAQLDELMRAREDVLALLSVSNKAAKQEHKRHTRDMPVLEPRSTTATPVVRSQVQPAIQAHNNLQGPALVAHCLAVLDAARQAVHVSTPPSPAADHRVGVTVISGFLGSGKTTLLKRILSTGHVHLPPKPSPPRNHPPATSTSPLPGQPPASTAAAASTDHRSGPASHHPPRFGVIVNDLASVNVDGALIQDVMSHVAPQSRDGTHMSHVAPQSRDGTHMSHVAPQSRDGTHMSHVAPQSRDGTHMSHVAPQSRDGTHMSHVAPQSRDGTHMSHVAPQSRDGTHMSHVAPQSRDGTDQVSGSDGHQLVQLTNGCICCGLRGDMLLEVSQLLSTHPSLDYLIIESTGVGQPLPIAAAFASTDHQGRSLMEHIRVDCMVTVVDASRFTHLLHTKQPASTAQPHHPVLSSHQTEAQPLHSGVASGAAGTAHHHHQQQQSETGGGRPPVQPFTSAAAATGTQVVLDAEDDRPLAELLVEQLEFADVVLLNKTDLVMQQSELDHVHQVVQGLAPAARVLPTCHCDVALSEVINTHRFDYEQAQQASRWQQELLQYDGTAGSEHRPETEVYGITSLVFESRTPFHPLRLAAFLNHGLSASLQQLPGTTQQGTTQQGTTQQGASAHRCSPLQPTIPAQVLLRSKGFFWLASCPEVAWEWSTAGAACSLLPYGEWLSAKVPRRLWPAAGARQGWDPVWGDKRTSLVFICQGKPDYDVLRQQLATCLMTEQELWQHDEGADAEGGTSDHEGKSDDRVWWEREEAWRSLPGAHVWAAALQEAV